LIFNFYVGENIIFKKIRENKNKEIFQEYAIKMVYRVIHENLLNIYSFD